RSDTAAERVQWGSAAVPRHGDVPNPTPSAASTMGLLTFCIARTADLLLPGFGTLVECVAAADALATLEQTVKAAQLAGKAIDLANVEKQKAALQDLAKAGGKVALGEMTTP
ncbi:hypothetical protein HaLaN_21900, partial [Haematococcus lacustris]